MKIGTKLYSACNNMFELTLSNNGWYRLSNPFDVAHSDKAMAINFSYNVVIDHRTGYKASIIDFLCDYLGLSRQDIFKRLDTLEGTDYAKTTDRVFKTKSNIQLPANFHFLHENVALAERARQYVLQRGYSIEYLTQRSIGFVNEGDWLGRIIIPFFDKGLKYYVGRSFTGSSYKYLNPKADDVGGIGKSEILYNIEALNTFKEIVLVEGAFDALAAGDNGIATLGWSVSDWQFSALVSSPVEIFKLAPDAGFYNKALQVAAKLLPHARVQIANLDNNPLGKDLDEIGISNVFFEELNYTDLWQKRGK